MKKSFCGKCNKPLSANCGHIGGQIYYEET